MSNTWAFQESYERSLVLVVHSGVTLQSDTGADRRSYSAASNSSGGGVHAVIGYNCPGYGLLYKQVYL